MGLDTTHNCWHGGYIGFNMFRENLAKAIGVNLHIMEGYVVDGLPWPSRDDEPLVSLLYHSDCQGDIPVEELIPLANRLDEVATLIEAGPVPAEGGHLARNGGTVAAARTFAEGCRLAAGHGEPVEFH